MAPNMSGGFNPRAGAQGEIGRADAVGAGATRGLRLRREKGAGAPHAVPAVIRKEKALRSPDSQWLARALAVGPWGSECKQVRPAGFG